MTYLFFSRNDTLDKKNQKFLPYARLKADVVFLQALPAAVYPTVFR
jgi:hypothetical protein